MYIEEYVYMVLDKYGNWLRSGRNYTIALYDSLGTATAQATRNNGKVFKISLLECELIVDKSK